MLLIQIILVIGSNNAWRSSCKGAPKIYSVSSLRTNHPHNEITKQNNNIHNKYSINVCMLFHCYFVWGVAVVFLLQHEPHWIVNWVQIWPNVVIAPKGGPIVQVFSLSLCRSAPSLTASELPEELAVDSWQRWIWRSPQWRRESCRPRPSHWKLLWQMQTLCFILSK